MPGPCSYHLPRVLLCANRSAAEFKGCPACPFTHMKVCPPVLEPRACSVERISPALATGLPAAVFHPRDSHPSTHPRGPRVKDWIAYCESTSNVRCASLGSEVAACLTAVNSATLLVDTPRKPESLLSSDTYHAQAAGPGLDLHEPSVATVMCSAVVEEGVATGRP